MCGRFTQHAPWAQIVEFSLPLDVAAPEHELPPSWNLAPTQHAYVIARTEDGAGFRLLTPVWGFAPRWARADGPHPINARAESVATSSMFRGAFGKGRCIVPANGWFEWRPEGKSKQPYLFEPANEPLFWLAGIRSGDTFAIITSDPVAESVGIHDRSPALIEHDHLDLWLDPATSIADAQALLLPGPEGRVKVRPVSRAIGNPRNNGPEFIEE